MSVNALNFLLLLNCFAKSVCQLKITILQREAIKLLVFQPHCAKIVSSVVLTDNWSRFQRPGRDNYSSNDGGSRLRRHEQHTALAIRWWNTDKGILSLRGAVRMEDVPGVFWLIAPASPSRQHTILPADFRFTRTLNPTDSGCGTPSPIHNRGARIASRKGNQSQGEDTDESKKRWDALEWYPPLSQSFEFRHYKAHV